MTFIKAIIIFTTVLAHLHNVGVIFVPAGRFHGGVRWAASLAMLAPGSRANTLVTKALSQDVMVLAFVSSIANPQGVAQPPRNQLIHNLRFNKNIPTLGEVNYFS